MDIENLTYDEFIKYTENNEINMEFVFNLCISNKTQYLLDILKYIIKNHDIDLNFRDSNGATFVHILCYNNNTQYLLDVLEYIKENNIIYMYNLVDNHGNTILHHLCYNKGEYFLDVLKYIIDNNVVDVNIINNNKYYNFLCQMCLTNNMNCLETFKYTIENSDIDLSGNNGGDSFKEALNQICCHYETKYIFDIIKYVIENKIIMDLTSEDKYGNNFLNYLCFCKTGEGDNINHILIYIIENNICMINDKIIERYKDNKYCDSNILGELMLMNNRINSESKSASKTLQHS